MNSEYWHTFLKLHPHILQFKEIIEELQNEEPDWGIICNLFLEMFEDLNKFIIALYCVEITKFVVALEVYASDFAPWEMPDEICDFIIDDPLMLYLYPAGMTKGLPEKLIQQSKVLTEKFKSEKKFRSNRDSILELLKNEYSLNYISDKLRISKHLVEKTMILEGYLSGRTPTHRLWSREEHTI